MTTDEEKQLYDRFSDILHEIPGLDEAILRFEKSMRPERENAAQRRPLQSIGVRMSATASRRLRPANDELAADA